MYPFANETGLMKSHFYEFGQIKLLRTFFIKKVVRKLVVHSNGITVFVKLIY